MTLTLRSLDLLATFTAERRRWRLADLAAASGLPLTTAHRIVTDLLAWGALERSTDGYLHVGLRLFEVASLAPRGSALREVALPYLEDLHVATRENVQLAVRDGLESVFVERLAGRGSVDVMTRVGGRFPLPATGVGRVLLAHATPEAQEAALSQPLRRWTEHTVTDAEALRVILAEVRRTGIAVSDRQVQPDGVSVAAPVVGAGREVIAAVSVVFRAGTASWAEMVPAVRAVSLGISRALGARRPDSDLPPVGIPLGTRGRVLDPERPTVDATMRRHT